LLPEKATGVEESEDKKKGRRGKRVEKGEIMKKIKSLQALGKGKSLLPGGKIEEIEVK